jgi:hypothetical protein
MGLFNLFKSSTGNKYRFLSETDFRNNLAKQEKMTPLTLEQLRKHNVSEDKELRLEYFFYTNTIDKAKAFAAELEKSNYESAYRQSAGNQKLYIITGWTIKIKMTDSRTLEWTKQMCELGYGFDCDFDGWGTDPTQ